MPRDTAQYGEYYWCIKVSEDMSEDGEIYVYADTCRVMPNGELVCLGHRNKKFEGEYIINIAVAPGKWNAVYAADILDGAAIAVVHWEGEIIEPA